MTHVSPLVTSNKLKKSVWNVIHELLSGTFSDATHPETRQSGIVGGYYGGWKPGLQMRLFRHEYVNTIRLLSGVTEDVLKIDPIVLSGPKTDPDGETDLFVGQERIVVTQSGDQSPITQTAFPSSKIRQEAERWKLKPFQRNWWRHMVK